MFVALASLAELTALLNGPVFKGKGGNWFKHFPQNVGNLLSRDAF